MKYVPIIKMKTNEIRLANYVGDYINHDNLIPFLEIIYEPNSSKKNSSYKHFLNNSDFHKTFFLGIPHKRSALVEKETMYASTSKANKSHSVYLSESLKLFNDSMAIPVFYVYDEEDANDVQTFINEGHKKSRTIGLMISTSIASEIDFSSLRTNDFVFVDIDSDKLSSKRIVLNKCLSGVSANVILVRENRKCEITNSVIETAEKAPFMADLSGEIADLVDKLDFHLYGFADYCGYKNTIATLGGGGNRDKMYPAWAMYSRENKESVYIGLKSSISMSNQKESFDELKRLTKEQLETIKNIGAITSLAMLENEKVGGYPFWNVLTQWHYLSQMTIYDDWKTITSTN